MAWQDTRNGNKDLQAEDIYFAAVRFPAEKHRSGGVPGWVLVAAAAAIGMGLAAILALALSRRSRSLLARR